MFMVSFFDYRILKNNPYLILIFYFLCLIALLGLFFFAPGIRGVKRWYKIGEITVDPVEIIKIVLLILLAKYFSFRHIEMYRIRHILLSGFYVLVPASVVFFQPDLGSVLILITLWIGILVISGISLRHFLILSLCFLLVFIISWHFALKDYQKARIISFVQPQLSDHLLIGWSHRQAKIAVGAGGIVGQGITKGSQVQYGFLPEPQTDFIFAALAEETGFIGISVLLFLFFILIWRTIKISLATETNFSRLFITGFIILLISQIFINIGMNLGILPIIGIPLPLVSYGGSSLIANYFLLGVLQSIKVRKY